MGPRPKPAAADLWMEEIPDDIVQDLHAYIDDESNQTSVSKEKLKVN